MPGEDLARDFGAGKEFARRGGAWHGWSPAEMALLPSGTTIFPLKPSAVYRLDVILEAQPDGTVHLPLPQELLTGQIRVVATLEFAAAETAPSRQAPVPGSLKGSCMSQDFDEPLEDFENY